MIIIFLKFSTNKGMAGHKARVKRGLDDGGFLLARSRQANLGGAILAHASTLPVPQTG